MTAHAETRTDTLDDAQDASTLLRSEDALALVRLDGHTVIDLNGAFAELTGYVRESLRDRSWLQLNLWLNPTQWEAAFAQLREDGIAQRMTTRLQLHSGLPADVEVSLRGVRIADQACYLASVTRLAALPAAETTPASKIVRRFPADHSSDEDKAFVASLDDREIAALLEPETLQEMMNYFYQVTGIGMGVIDLKGNILVATGWQDICTQFHRVHPETRAFCLESDVYLSANVSAGQYSLYQCKNRMWDQASPIICSGRHIANIFLGQFFFDDEAVDVDAFAAQADRYGLDREKYLEALSRVPRWSRDKVHNVMSFYTRLATQIARTSYGKLKLQKSLDAHQRAQAALEVSEEKYRSIVDNISIAIFRASVEGKLLAANPAFAAMFGFADTEEAIAQVTDIGRQLWGSYEIRQEVVAEVLEAGAVEGIEAEFRRQSGEAFTGSVSFRLGHDPATGAPFLEGRIEDISERKRAQRALQQHQEELERQVKERTEDLQRRNRELEDINRRLADTQLQLLQSEKMASIGQLAAGVAHEINNPLGFINANLSTLKEDVDDLFAVIDAYRSASSLIAASPEIDRRIRATEQRVDLAFLSTDIRALIDQSLDGARRVKNIVQDLKDFSRVDCGEWTMTNIERGIDSTLNIVWNEIKYKAELIKEYAGLPEIECIAGQVNQVVMNLLINAAQAIDEQGTIIVRTGADHEWAWIEIADTGRGIEPEHLTRIFDPFFTTKPVGVGTGLGLSLSYSIVKRHGGKLEVSSQPGKGTTFRMTIPKQRREQTGA